MCVLIWVHTSIYCICLSLVKDHERDHSDCQIEDRVWAVTIHISLKWYMGRNELVPPEMDTNSPTCVQSNTITIIPQNIVLSIRLLLWFCLWSFTIIKHTQYNQHNHSEQTCKRERKWSGWCWLSLVVVVAMSVCVCVAPACPCVQWL